MRVLFPYMARWHAVNWGRYHALLSAVAKAGHEVTVLHPPAFSGSDEIGWQDVHELPVPSGLRLQEVQMPGWWSRRWPLDKLVRKGSFALAASQHVYRAIREQGVDTLLVYNIPLLPLVSVARRAWADEGRQGTVAFDLADNLLAMLKREAHLLAPAVGPIGGMALRRLIRTSDVVTAASVSLLDLCENRGNWLPNGVELGHIGYRTSLCEPKAVGFIGAWEYFVNLDLVVEVVSRMPDWTFHFVGGGRRQEDARVRLSAFPNVCWHGPVPHNAIERHLHAWNVGLVPFGGGPVAKDSSPLKALDYLAAGAAVVTTPIPELERLQIACPGVISVADSASGFIGAIRRMADAPANERAQARAYVSSRYNWERLASEWASLASPVGKVSSPLHQRLARSGVRHGGEPVARVAAIEQATH